MGWQIGFNSEICGVWLYSTGIDTTEGTAARRGFVGEKA